MTVAARQLDLDAPPAPTARTWANSTSPTRTATASSAVQGRRRPTPAATRASRSASSARPATRCGLTEPRIYFGERSAAEPPYVVARQRPRRGRAARARLAGARLPLRRPWRDPVAGLLRRAAFAARFQDLKLAADRDRHRPLADRPAPRRRASGCELLAPFLRWDRHPQTVVAGGRVQFLFHGYTTSDTIRTRRRWRSGTAGELPARAGGRGGGRVQRARDALRRRAERPDPARLARRLPGPVHAAGASMPRAAARAPALPAPAVRRPRPSCTRPTTPTTPTGFWNGADAWQQARELAGAVEEAGEIHFPDPSASSRRAREARAADAAVAADCSGRRGRERFMLTTAFTPRGRENLVGYLAGSVDPASGRPRLTLLSLPRDRLTTGPTQATRQMLAEPGDRRAPADPQPRVARPRAATRSTAPCSARRGSCRSATRSSTSSRSTSRPGGAGSRGFSS